MVFFIIVIIRIALKVAWYFIQTVLISIFIFLLIGFIWLSCIDSDGRDRVFLLPFIILAVIFLFFLSSFFRRLQVIKTMQSWQWFRTLRFNFFYPGVFFYLELGVSLDHNSVYWLTALIIVLIGITTYRDLYLGLGFSPSSFFDQSIPII